MIASNFCVIARLSEKTYQKSDQEPATDRDDVFEDRARAVLSAACRCETLSRFGPGHGAEHCPDNPGADGAEGVEEGAADDRPGKSARQKSSDELRSGLAARGLRQLIGYEFDQQENRQDGD